MSRRESLSGISQPPVSANRGLWLDRYLASMDRGGDDDAGSSSAKGRHLEASQRIETPVGYTGFEQQRRSALDALPNTRVLQLATTSRTIVGIGGASPWENSITLHHTWGVPLVPGSALKGLAASYAHKRLENESWRRRLPDKKDSKGGDWHNLLFGTTDERGLVCFHDALWSSDVAVASCGLRLDTITVHHPEYYQGKDKPPADWDSPTPIPFLSFNGALMGAVTWCGGDASREAIDCWLETAMSILEEALKEEGVGARTSSGYGRMTTRELVGEAEEGRRALRRAVDDFVFPTTPGELSKLDAEVERLSRADEGADLFARFVGRVEGLAGPAKKLAKKRLSDFAARPDRAALASEVQRAPWFQAEGNAASAGPDLATLRTQLAELNARKPGKKDKRIKKWRKEHDDLSRKIEALEKGAEKKG
jgi:CRISPR-associated protein Cmr6